MKEIAPGVAVISIKIVNTYLVGEAGSWVLVDSGMPGSTDKIKAAAEERFGSGAKPNGIVLTHGHFDHAGSAGELAQMWDVPVYAHRLEFPYLTGKSLYPPFDPTAPGFFSALSQFFPEQTPRVASRLSAIDASHPFPGLSGWACLDTPGHTPGHVSFYRQSDGVLLAGDAFATVNMDSFLGLITQRPEVRRPPVPATTDWEQARSSVRRLADLHPKVLGAGHGKPMGNYDEQLERLAANFPVPKHGRYVPEPARADENGITFLPPAPPDRVPKVAAGLAVGITFVAAGTTLLRRKS